MTGWVMIHKNGTHKYIISYNKMNLSSAIKLRIVEWENDPDHLRVDLV